MEASAGKVDDDPGDADVDDIPEFPLAVADLFTWGSIGQKQF